MNHFIAVIGMACRFPGAPDVEAYRRLLEEGREAIRTFTDEELAAAGVPESVRRDPAYVPACAALEGIEDFDADFFGIPPREAEIMDPQHRVFLEEAWTCLESAGIDPARCRRKIGVFAAANLSTYLLHHLHGNPRALEFVAPLQVLMANNNHFVPTRVSYKLGLRGPSVNVNCACSSSLVAVHLACQSLLNYECDMALAGGVAVQLPQDQGYLYAADGILSPDGHCRPFDAAAEGTISGNGAGVVLLKRLDEAVADGDRIRAVVRGSAINNDGNAKIGFTAPGVDGQADAIALALAAAEVDPATITYVEAHGTGTRVGDPIELAALARVFREKTTRTGYCAIGSVKSNFGHLDEAAGVAGFIKTVLMLENRRVFPTLHFRSPNPECAFGTSPFHVAAKAVPWETGGIPRRAGVSSFGLGGTNAHAVLEEYAGGTHGGSVSAAAGVAREPWQWLPISARSASSLESLTGRLAASLDGLDGNPSVLADAAWTLQTGRARFPFRRVVVARDAAEAARHLRCRDAEHVVSNTTPASVPPAPGTPASGTPASVPPASATPPVVFLFSGHGGQYPGMGRGLYENEPVFREALDGIAAALSATAKRDIREIIMGDDVHRIEWTQPAVFALQVALVRLWASRGVRPVALMGHSAGEYAAACAAGVFSPEEGVRLMAERGRLIRSTRPGAMLAVPLPEEEVIARLGASRDLAVAVMTTPGMCVLSGDPGAVEDFRKRAEVDEIECRPVEIDRAAHSPLMDAITGPFREVVAGLPLAPPKISLVSNVTGAPMDPAEATSPDYWARHLRAPVRFSDGIAALARRHPGAVFLEIGPGRTLAAPVARHPAASACTVLSSIRHPEDPIDDSAFFARTTGQLWVAGVEIDAAAEPAGSRRRLPLATTPFERRRFWIEPPHRPEVSAPVEPGPDVATWLYEPAWVEALPPVPVAEAGRVAVVETEEGIGDALAAALAKRGAVVTRVSFERGGTADALPDCLGDPLPDRLVFLAGADESDPARVHGRLAGLARALGERAGSRPCRLVAVAPRMEDSPGQAALQGILRVLPLEYPAVSCRMIGIDRADEETLRCLVDEILDADETEPVVSYRAGRRRLPDAHRIGNGTATFEPWRDGGVYLVTGGLGSMGLAFAEWIARHCRARIVLADRAVLPGGEAGRAVRERLDAIRRRGATVEIETVDISDAHAVFALVARAREQGPLVGVIHTAGIIGGALLRDMTTDGSAAVFAPKLGGARALEEALASSPPEFLVSCSSLATRIPVAGQADYVAANAALDAWTRRFARRTGTYAVSIAWGFWQDLGMIAQAAMPAEEKRRIAGEIRRRGWSGAGVEVLGAILRRRLGPEVIVSPEPIPPRTVARPVAHPLLGERLEENGAVHFRARFSAGNLGLLDDHRLEGRPVLVGTAYLEMARAAFAEMKGEGPVEIRDAVFLQPLVLDPGEEREVRTILVERAGSCDFFVASSSTPKAEASWRLHARGEVMRSADEKPRPDDVSAASHGTFHDAPPEFHARMEGFGPRWSNIEEVRFTGDGSRGTAMLAMPEAYREEAAAFALHPALLDNATGFLPIHAAPAGSARLPFSYARVRFHGTAEGRLRAAAHATGPAGDESATYAVRVTDDGGRPVLEAEGYALRRVETAPGAARPENAALELSVRGSFDAMGLASAPRPEPGPGEVEIEVKHVALNFIETLYALNLLPDVPGLRWRFGLECAGTVARVGPGVTTVAPGDRVMAFSNGASRLFMTAPASRVAPVPAGLSLEEAATMPAAYMTAYTALVRRGNLRRGETVLVHSAAGGVGLAAVNVARAVGARVLATAGTGEKRDYLGSLGIDAVMDSRTGSFARDVMERTAGRGVDVVLNSLGGEMIDLGLSVLAPGGRFLELGKRDILAGTSISLARFAKMISFIAIDVGPDMPGFDETWAEVRGRIEAGDFPPLPFRVFSAAAAAAAFGEMAKGRHIGRLLLDFSDHEACLASLAPGSSRLQSLAEIAGAPGETPVLASAAPTGTRGIVARIWSELLGRAVIGDDDDFFALQGDSLLGAQVVARLRKALGVKLPISALFEDRTVAKLAARIDALLAPADGEEEGTI